MLPPTAPRQTLLYLPGLDATGRLLFRQARLASSYELLCESYPQDRVVTYEELAAAAARRLEAATGGRPAIVLAESFGGAVGLTLALSRPDLVERLLLVNTFAYFHGRLKLRLVATLGRFFPQKPGHPATRPLRGFFFFSPDIVPTERTAWWEHTADVPLAAMGRRLQMIVRLDLRSRLREITTPVLVLAAPNDRVVSPVAGRELARLLPNARLIEPAVGHAAMLHPSTDIAALLEDPAHWPSLPARDTSATASRPA